MSLPLWVILPTIIALLLVLLAVGMPIAFSLLFLSIIGLLLSLGPGPTWDIMSYLPYRSSENFFFLCVPMFILMGQLLYYSGLTEKLYAFASKWVGHFRGGLAIASVLACAFFAAASGSSTATAAAVGKVAVPEMIRYGYNRSFASGLVATSGTLGILIPPSIGLVIYGLITGTSIGRLLVAGILPGVLTALSYIIVVIIIAWRRPQLVPAGGNRASWRERFTSVPSAWPFLAIFVIVMGGIYFGVMQSGEAGAIGAVATIMILLVMRRLNFRILHESLKETTFVSISIFAIVMAALCFGAFLVHARIPIIISEFFIDLHFPPIVMMGLVLLLFLLMGTFMEVGAIVMIALPFVFPTLAALHNDPNFPVWFGILSVRCMEVGLVTPPLGMNVYVLKSSLPDVPLEEIFRGIIPFLVADAVVITILILFPQITLFLPNLMWGSR